MSQTNMLNKIDERNERNPKIMAVTNKYQTIHWNFVFWFGVNWNDDRLELADDKNRNSKCFNEFTNEQQFIEIVVLKQWETKS